MLTQAEIADKIKYSVIYHTSLLATCYISNLDEDVNCQVKRQATGQLLDTCFFEWKQKCLLKRSVVTNGLHIFLSEPWDLKGKFNWGHTEKNCIHSCTVTGQKAAQVVLALYMTTETT